VVEDGIILFATTSRLVLGNISLLRIKYWGSITWGGRGGPEHGASPSVPHTS